MKIENISQNEIKKVDNRELYSLRLRFLQVWNKHFGKQIEKIEELDRSLILDKYQILKKEMEARKLKYNIKELDKILFKKTIYNIDVPSLNDYIIVKDFISLSGDFVKNPKGVDKADIVIRSKKGNNDGMSELASIIGNTIKKKCNVIWKAEGPDCNYIPLYDLILMPKSVTKRVEISKPETIGKYHRIPVNECKITATIDISKEKGIKALYCGDEKKIATFLFDIDKWTMPEAKKWVSVHKNDEIEKAEAPSCENKVTVSKGVIGYRKTPKAPEDESWDGAKEVKEADVDDLKVMCAWYDTEHSDTKAAYKLPHHKSKGYAVVWNGVSAAMAALLGARGGVDIPDADREGVYRHLVSHYKEFDKKPPKLHKSIRIFKMDVDQQIVGGVVYEPDEVDAQGDRATAEEIEKAAHKFNIGKRVFKVMHEGKEVDADLLESYIMPADVTINGTKVKKGSWFVVVKVNDKGVWNLIKSGKLTGFSMGGEADRDFSLS